MLKTAFISYASADEAVAATICRYLEGDGLPCWMAPRDVRAGADYASEIIDGIEASAVFVLVLSEHANASKFVKREVERAVSKGKPLFPVRVREVIPSRSLELFISSTEWIDAWQLPIEPTLERLARAIRSAASVAAVGGADRPDTVAAPAAQQRVTERAVSIEDPRGGRPPIARRHLAIAAAAAIGVVAMLGLLLRHGPGKQPPGTSTAAAGSAEPRRATRPAAATSTDPAAQPPDAANTGPLASADLCPRSLAVNRDMPTPYTCRCGAQPEGGSSIWGTDIYTDDSWLCGAAMHAGVIALQGGLVTVMRTEGRMLYAGSTRDGLRSSDYGAYPHSIEFKGTRHTPGPEPCPGSLGINRRVPTPYTCRCTAEATGQGSVWGTDVYTDDSSLCRAALHAGRVPRAGGPITVIRSEGRALYAGSSRNGVSSSDYGAYTASIAFR